MVQCKISKAKIAIRTKWRTKKKVFYVIVHLFHTQRHIDWRKRNWKGQGSCVSHKYCRYIYYFVYIHLYALLLQIYKCEFNLIEQIFWSRNLSSTLLLSRDLTMKLHSMAQAEKISFISNFLFFLGKMIK